MVQWEVSATVTHAGAIEIEVRRRERSTLVFGGRRNRWWGHGKVRSGIAASSMETREGRRNQQCKEVRLTVGKKGRHGEGTFRWYGPNVDEGLIGLQTALK